MKILSVIDIAYVIIELVLFLLYLLLGIVCVFQAYSFDLEEYARDQIALLSCCCCLNVAKASCFPDRW